MKTRLRSSEHFATKYDPKIGKVVCFFRIGFILSKINILPYFFPIKCSTLKQFYALPLKMTICCILLYEYVVCNHYTNFTHQQQICRPKFQKYPGKSTLTFPVQLVIPTDLQEKINPTSYEAKQKKVLGFPTLWLKYYIAIPAKKKLSFVAY